MTVAVFKALHSPIPVILDAVFASLPPAIFPQVTLNYIHHSATLHNFLFFLDFIPQLTSK